MTCELLMGIWDPSDTGYVTREESAATASHLMTLVVAPRQKLRLTPVSPRKHMLSCGSIS